MMIVDLVIVLGLTLFVYMGARRGMIDELLGLTGWIIAILLALKFGGTVAELIHRKATSLPGPVSSIVAFLLILFFVRAGFLMFSQWFQKMFNETTKNAINKFIGGLFGFIIGAFFISIVVFAISVFPLSPKIKNLENQSVLWEHMSKFSRIVVDAVIKFVPETQESIESMAKKIEQEVKEMEEEPSAASSSEQNSSNQNDVDKSLIMAGKQSSTKSHPDPSKR